MFKFKTPKKTRGMTDEQYIKSVFYRNRKILVEKFGHVGTLERFKKNVMAQKVIYGVSTKEALKKLAKSEVFTPERERLVNNVREAIRNFGKTKEFQELTRDERGRFTKFDESKIRWDKESHMYIYDNRVTITFEQSPHDLILGVI